VTQPATVVPLDPEVARMLAFQRGDDAAFDALYAQWWGPVRALARRILGRAGEADEVAQEVFVRLYRARGRYQPTAAFRTYLYRIATHLCLNERRRASFRREQPGLAEERAGATSASDPEDAAAGAALGRAVEAALSRLPERQRAAVVLARYDGCSMAELAEILGTSEGAAKVLLHRARVQLRAELAAWLDPEDR
jgi:RNA polymerase sigma-70 factor (ECF subfamily)